MVFTHLSGNQVIGSPRACHRGGGKSQCRRWSSWKPRGRPQRLCRHDGDLWAPGRWGLSKVGHKLARVSVFRDSREPPPSKKASRSIRALRMAFVVLVAAQNSQEGSFKGASGWPRPPRTSITGESGPVRLALQWLTGQG